MQHILSCIMLGNSESTLFGIPSVLVANDANLLYFIFQSENLTEKSELRVDQSLPEK